LQVLGREEKYGWKECIGIYFLEGGLVYVSSSDGHEIYGMNWVKQNYDKFIVTFL
jgi:hypothetical protein